MSLPSASDQLHADLLEEQSIGFYRWMRDKRQSDLDPIFDVRPSSRGGAEQVGGHSLLHAAAVDGLVLTWFIATELVALIRRRSPKGLKQ